MRALQRHAHHHEQGHRDQRLVRDDPEYAAWQEPQIAEIEYAEQCAAEGEQQRDAGERGRHGIAREQRDEHRREHDERQVFSHARRVWGRYPRNRWISQKASKPVWSSSRHAEAGINVFSRNTPPNTADLLGAFQDRPGVRDVFDAEEGERQAKRRHEAEVSSQIYQAALPLGHPAVRQVDPHVFVVLERVGKNRA